VESPDKDGLDVEKRTYNFDTDNRLKEKPTDPVRRDNPAQDPRGTNHEV